MSSILYADNNLDLLLQRIRYGNGGGPINDAVAIVSIGDVLVTGRINGATNASPIVVTSPGHGLLDDDEIVIVDVVGNKATNGPQTVASAATDTFALAGTTGSGPIILPSDTSRYGTWFKTVEGLHGVPLSYFTVAGMAMEIPWTANLIPGQDYWIVVTLTNYGYQVQTRATCKVRQLGSFP